MSNLEVVKPILTKRHFTSYAAAKITDRSPFHQGMQKIEQTKTTVDFVAVLEPSIIIHRRERWSGIFFASK